MTIDVSGFRVQGLAPVARPDARILILGTMPGVVSLARGQYYGNPRNAFWGIAAALFGVDAAADYDARLQALMATRVALWDVLADCERRGSLDSAIVASSVAPNDLPGFFAAHPQLEVVALNGAKAAQLYRRHVVHPAGLRLLALPSTSPAHAAQRFEDKLTAWRPLIS
ncbi:DNA-deoxyinosine glycosylase [Bordetella avium]|uniref:DNA-deoxyinosine glycosylase n=1 Tax=Bordetella avium TaxID=521 RepID=UPI000E6A13C2|nr:DNA-deoxyinosine glycosylase [Bordetella avium]RIQ18125.1 DNA-deoxyinosine glycosylase [Bordetella avium]